MNLLAEAVPLQPIVTPPVDWRAISPELALVTGAVILLLLVAWFPRMRAAMLATACLVTLAVTAGLTVWNWSHPAVAFERAFSADGITRYVRVVLIAAGVLATLMAAHEGRYWHLQEADGPDAGSSRHASRSSGRASGARSASRLRREGPGAATATELLPPSPPAEVRATQLIGPDVSETAPPEVFPLLLFAIAGMSLFASASDLLVAFIALEILSLSLYVMTGATRRLRSEEAAMKYFLLGAFSSAFLLYGIALIYGATGTTKLAGISAAIANPATNLPLVLAGVGLLAVGFCFKIGAVPFHMWTPDVYQGAPTSIAAFMSAATKVAAFGAFLRVFVGGFGGLATSWQPVLAAVAVATMVVGAVVAVVQTDFKRILAYSSIANAGYLMVGLVANTPAGISASMFYLLAYTFAVMGSFMVVEYVQRSGGGDRSPMNDYRGFARRHPWAGAMLALFLFSLAGIPPFAGFFGKYFVFQAGVDAGYTWLVLVGVISAVVVAFIYLRVVVVSFLQEPEEGTAATGSARSRMLDVAVAIAALATVLLGLTPGFAFDAAKVAGTILG